MHSIDVYPHQTNIHKQFYALMLHLMATIIDMVNQTNKQATTALHGYKPYIGILHLTLNTLILVEISLMMFENSS